MFCTHCETEHSLHYLNYFTHYILKLRFLLKYKLFLPTVVRIWINKLAETVTILFVDTQLSPGEVIETN